jgi:3-isopropylmalate dehydrogenase
LLLDWYAQRSRNQEYTTAANAIREAIGAAILSREVTKDIGGNLGTKEAGDVLVKKLLVL